MTVVLLSDDVVLLRPLTLEDVDEWLAGEDDEIVRWFEFPRASERADVGGAGRTGTEPSDSGGTFIIHRYDLAALIRSG